MARPSLDNRRDLDIGMVIISTARQSRSTRYLALLAAIVLLAAACVRQSGQQHPTTTKASRLAVTVNSDEAEAVLALLSQRRAGAPLDAKAWARVFE